MAKKYSKRSINKDYELDLTKYDFGSFLKTKQGVGAAGAAGMAGSLISGLSNGDPTAGAIGGALSGAASGAALGPLGMAGGAIIGGATSLLQASAAKKAKEAEEYRQNVQQSMQADQNYKAQLQNQQANIPTFGKGGNLRLYPEGGKVKKDPTLATTVTVADPLHDIMAANRQTILKGGIDSDTLYETPESPNSYFTALKGDSTNTANPYTQRFLTNWNNRYAKEQGFAYDPNAPTLRALPQTSTWKPVNPTTIDTMSTSFKPVNWRNPTPYNPEAPGALMQDQGTPLGGGVMGVGKTVKRVEGGYTIDYKGASHAGGGIQVNGSTGNPIQGTGEQADAEVEGNETAAKFPGENTPYIFSDKLGFAKKARAIEKKYSLRPNEKLSQDSMYMELGGLMQEQEEVRNKKRQYYLDKAEELGGNPQEDTFEKGGFMGIHKSHKGWCTPMSKSTCTGARRRLALTLKKHHGFHEDGGELEQYTEGGNMESPCIGCLGYAMCGGHLSKHVDGGELFGTSEQTYLNPQPQFTDNTQTFNINNAVDTTSIPTTIAPQQEQTTPYRGSNLPLYMGIGTGLANLGLAASVQTPKDITPITINPGKIDSNPMRRDILENAARSRANRLAALRNSGLSQAQYISAVSTGDSDINQSTGNLIRQNEMDVQSKNISMNQSAQETNAKAINEANLYNAQQKYGAQQQRRSYVTNALQSVSGGVKSYMDQREMLDAGNASSPYMELVKDKYGNVRRRAKKGI